MSSQTNEAPALAAKQRVEAGLEALRVGLAPYVARHMRDRHGPNWRHYASRAHRDEPGWRAERLQTAGIRRMWSIR